jgi:hypothetical protein
MHERVLAEHVLERAPEGVRRSGAVGDQLAGALVAQADA